ncbi:MAG TPA: DUF2017 family protein [Acidimicrobiales bacterium]|nr:DUF2017 family protein [Acidimicrobiales bacterium]
MPSPHRRVRRNRRGEYLINLPPDERELLRSLPGQLVELLSDPSSPDLRRIFPPAYVEDDQAEREYRRLMEEELTTRHRVALETMAATVDASRLDQDQMAAWASALNDLRLVLGTRLDVSEDMQPPDPDDPRAPAHALYGYLSWLQEQVVEALAAGL